MSKTLSIPANVNPLSPNGFRFIIQKLPDIEYFCQKVHVPGITFGAPMLATPFRRVPIPGDELTYDNLTVQFLIDENMDNYIAVYNWIVALGFPQNYQQYIDYVSANQSLALGELATNYSNATLQILDNTNNPVKTVNFNDILPVALETLEFDSTTEGVNYLVGSATFTFSYYTFANVNGVITKI